METSKKLYELIANEIIGQIVSGEMVPMQYLPNEMELTEHYNVSKTVIREAVKVLSAKGLVQVCQGKGTIVTSAEQWNVLDTDVLMAMSKTGKIQDLTNDIIALRRAIEGEAAALAALHATPEDMEKMTEALETMKVKQGNVEKYEVADIAFHDAVVMASKNSLICYIMMIVNDLRKKGVFLKNKQKVKAASLHKHEMVLHMIEKHNSEGAQKAMIEVIEEFKRHYDSEEEKG